MNQPPPRPVLTNLYIIMRTRNTFLDFSARHKPLRRSSTDPCILSPSSSEATADSEPKTTFSSTININPYKIFVGSLPANVDENFLFYYMSYFGRVKSVVIKRNLTTGQSRRYGYVKFIDQPRNEIYELTWMINDKAIRIKAYEINPCWKNDYKSDNDDADDAATDEEQQ